MLSTSPDSSEKETPSTACTVPSSVAKSTFRSLDLEQGSGHATYPLSLILGSSTA